MQAGTYTTCLKMPVSNGFTCTSTHPSVDHALGQTSEKVYTACSVPMLCPWLWQVSLWYTCQGWGDGAGGRGPAQTRRAKFYVPRSGKKCRVAGPESRPKKWAQIWVYNIHVSLPVGPFSAQKFRPTTFNILALPCQKNFDKYHPIHGRSSSRLSITAGALDSSSCKAGTECLA